MDRPCSDRCPTYAMCKSRDAVNRYRICQHFKKYVDCVIKDTQYTFDKERGEGKTTVVAIKVKDIETMIDKDGRGVY